MSIKPGIDNSIISEKATHWVARYDNGSGYMEYGMHPLPFNRQFTTWDQIISLLDKDLQGCHLVDISLCRRRADNTGWEDVQQLPQDIAYINGKWEVIRNNHTHEVFWEWSMDDQDYIKV